jgi:hypothetical protein
VRAPGSARRPRAGRGQSRAKDKTLAVIADLAPPARRAVVVPSGSSLTTFSADRVGPTPACCVIRRDCVITWP